MVEVAVRVEALSIEALALVEVVALRHKCQRLLKLWWQVALKATSDGLVKGMGPGERDEGSDGEERLVGSSKEAVKQKCCKRVAKFCEQQMNE